MWFVIKDAVQPWQDHTYNDMSNWSSYLQKVIQNTQLMKKIEELYVCDVVHVSSTILEVSSEPFKTQWQKIWNLKILLLLSKLPNTEYYTCRCSLLTPLEFNLGCGTESYKATPNSNHFV